VDSIIEQESGWNPQAVNESSGAAGLAQNISGYSGNYSRNDPMEQIQWLFNYLNGHNYEGYGTGIDAAYAHKQETGWY
jgi:soluble lytic murein transglycosylase-like protein